MTAAVHGQKPCGPAAIALLAVLPWLLPSVARADVQISTRLVEGGGAAFLPDDTVDGLFELALRGEALFGPGNPWAFRVGPALELRTDDFVTAEAAAGVALLLPVSSAFPIEVVLGAGWASRPGDADAPVALGTLAWGFRSYNYQSAYAFAFQVYVTGRTDLDRSGMWQITGGIELDLEFLIGIPVLFVHAWLTHGDPDEPE